MVRRPVVVLRRLLLAFGGLLIAGALLGAVPPKLELERQSPSLVGQLLVASPAIGDPRFSRTVILLARHTKDGAFGVVINRPLKEHSLASVLELFGEKDTSTKGNVQVFSGGPVRPEICFVIHTTDYERPETMAVSGLVAVTSSKEVLRDMGHHSGPRKALVAFGYAGWGPGQLEAELARNDWSTIAAEPDLIFDMNRERVWEAAMARRPRDL
jgi:putative transcriptional regulator